MDSDIRSNPKVKPHDGVMTLEDLRQFLTEELQDLEQSPNFSRAFQPLTDGLGLETPACKEPVARPPMPPPARLSQRLIKEVVDEDGWAEEAPLPFLPPEQVNHRPYPRPESFSRPEAEQTLASAISDPMATPMSSPLAVPNVLDPMPAVPKPPPPVPSPSFARRALAGLIDEVFLLSIFGIAVVITSNVLSGFKTGVSSRMLTHFSHPVFIRFAALEFSTLWLTYFAVGIGLLDMTFGMWVWGMRVSYGEPGTDPGSRFVKRCLRILLSFFFFAPVLPVLALAFRIRGRNLLDYLSGTRLYRSAALEPLS